MADFRSAILLAELPAPPPGRSGWPWTEATPPSEPRMPSGGEWPLVTIVTPSFNQGQFIEETIRSVLLQGYPNLEYLILDGGSTDETVAVLRRYDRWITRWISEKDAGQTSALNRGFRMAAGSLIGWQNSDDYYYPGAFQAGAIAASETPADQVFYGENDYVDANSAFICKKNICPPDFEAMIPWPCISNQAMLFRRSIFDAGHFLDEQFKHYMDYEFFWRLMLAGVGFHYCAALAGALRSHENAKSAVQGSIAQNEGFGIYRWIASTPNLAKSVRRKLIGAMQQECLNDFGQIRVERFRTHVHELAQTGGWSAVSAPLVVRYVISLFGERSVRLVANR